MADAVLPTKIAVLVLFFVVTMLCGLLPMLLARLARSWTQRFKSGRTGEVMSYLRGHGDLVVSCIMCLGAGVLLATIFTHMIPEAREVFAEIEAAGLFPDIGVPPGELFLCAGFFLVYFIEEAAHAFMARGRRRKHKRTAPHAAAEAGEKASEDSSVNSEESVTTTLPVTHAGHDHFADLATAGQHAFRAYLIVIALSVHSVFEGFAAAFEDTPHEVWIFFAAIMAHKAIVAFCIGEQLLNTKRSTCFVVSNLIIFSLATPLGVLLGLVVASPSQQGGGTLLATGILQGLAAGTILYVIFFELLGPEQHKPGPGLLKFFAMVLGFVLMLIIHSTGGHSHSHGGHSHAVGAHGHGPHDHAGVHHGHDHGAHGDDHNDVVRRVENAIHAHDHDNHDHSKPHDHSEHPKDNQQNVNTNVDSHGHDHDHDHDHGHNNAVPPKTVKVLDDHSNHDHDHSNHDHDLPNHDHDHSSHDHHDHSDHDHSTDRSHIDHSSEAGNGPGADNGTLYEIIDSHEETKDSVNVRPVPLPGQNITTTEKSGNEEEKHHFHADGHDHLGSESSKIAGHDHHDHGDHTDHDHADHNHSDHAAHEHMDQDRTNGTDHGAHDHSDHGAHDHTDHGAHDHSDHSGHDHGAHDHTDHGPHEHADNQHPGSTSDITARDTSADLDVTSAHGAAEEFKDLTNRTSTLPDSDVTQANRTEVNSR